jgi:hypothetical protein
LGQRSYVATYVSYHLGATGRIAPFQSLLPLLDILNVPPDDICYN